jgi:AraC-like DNA-binding protein
MLKDMDKLSAVVSAMADWISGDREPPLIYAALSRSRSINSPAPLVGILFQAEGEYDWFEQGGVRFRLPHNHIHAGFSHKGACSAVPGPSTGFWACAFDASKVAIFDDVAYGPPVGSMPIRNPARLCQAYQEVATQFLMRQPTSRLKLKAALLSWLAVLLDEIHGVGAGKGALLPEAVEKALDHMHRQIANSELSLQDVARASGLSLQHFGRLFAGAMQESPMLYLRRVRIEHAKNLLRDTRLRIGEVAREAGFADPLHFSRGFHRIAGQSPREFRRKRG